MKTNKFTLALAAMGLISLASAAQAQTIIYLTGSTAARQYVYNALTTPGQVFTAAPTHINDPFRWCGSDSFSPLKAMLPALAIRSTIALHRFRSRHRGSGGSTSDPNAAQ